MTIFFAITPADVLSSDLVQATTDSEWDPLLERIEIAGFDPETTSFATRSSQPDSG